jgi:hypothetical protein
MASASLRKSGQPTSASGHSPRPCRRTLLTFRLRGKPMLSSCRAVRAADRRFRRFLVIQLSLYFRMKLFKRFVVRFEMHRLPILGDARNYDALSVKIDIDLSLVGDFENGIWPCHSKYLCKSGFPLWPSSWHRIATLRIRANAREGSRSLPGCRPRALKSARWVGFQASASRARNCRETSWSNSAAGADGGSAVRQFTSAACVTSVDFARAVPKERRKEDSQEVWLRSKLGTRFWVPFL